MTNKPHSFNKLCLILLIITGIPVFLTAQTSVAPAGNAPGSPSGSYPLSSIESISLYSGKVSAVVPLARVGGRGNAGYSMVYPIKDSHWLTEVDADTTGTFVAAIDHPDDVSNSTRTVFVRPFEYGTVSIRYTANSPGCPDGSQVWHCYRYAAMTLVFTSADGTEHALYDDKRGGVASVIDGIYPNNTWTPALDRGLVFSAKDGSGWSFAADQETQGQTDYLVDPYGQYYQIEGESSSGERLVSGYLKNNDGTVVRFVSSRAQWIQDRNGNKTTFVYETGGPNITKLDKVIDANGRVTDIVYGSGYEQVVYNGTGGQSRTITISHDALQNRLVSGNTIKTIAGLFPAHSPESPYTFVNGNTTFNPTVVSSVTLPDSRAYELYYNSYGELGRIQSPSGAAVEYTYGAGVSYAYSSGQVGHLFPTDSNCGQSCLDTNVSIFRRLLERREYPHGGSTPKLKTEYGLYESIDDSSGITRGKIREDQIDADTSGLLTRTDHFFDGDPTSALNPGALAPVGLGDLLEGREYKTENLDVDAGTVLARTESQWNVGCLSARESCGTGSIPAQWSPFIEWKKSSLYESGSGQYLVAKTEFSYDNYNNTIDILSYDFGVSQPGTFLRRTHTDYETDSTHINVNLTSLPSLTWISSDPAGNYKKSLTQFEYDNYASNTTHAALTSRSNVTGFDLSDFGSGNTVRGNVTAVTSYSDAAGQNGAVTVYSQFDILGNVVKVIDANGYVSTITYTDNFGAPDSDVTTPSVPSQISGYNTFAYPTSTTNPKGWTSYVQYDYFTGAPVNAQDITGIISKTIYNDSLDRPTQTVAAIGTALESQTTINYQDSSHYVEKTSDLNSLNDNLLRSRTIFDEMGRTIETRSYEADGNYRAIQIQYDALSRGYKRSNPFRPTEIDASHPILWTTSAFESIGRPKNVTIPDNSVISTAYDGIRTMITDPAGKRRISKINALGQLTDVWEVTAQDSATEAVTFNGVSGLYGYRTAYSYDTLGNLKTVIQGGQERDFVYDSLSRLTSAQNPESGTVTNTYDSNGNLKTKRDARNIKTIFDYDSLNRVTDKCYRIVTGALGAITCASAGTESLEPNTPDVTYSYDDNNIANSKGHLTKIDSSASTTEYTGLDQLGRVTQSTQTTDGITFGNGTTDSHMVYTYNLAGALIEEQYPSGRLVKNVLQNDGSLSLVESRRDANSGYWHYADAFTYSPTGVITSMQLGNGTWESSQLNSRLQPTQIALGATQNGDSLWKINYEFGELQGNGTVDGTKNIGNIGKQTITVPTIGTATGFSAIQSFTYDDLRRLKTSVETTNSSQIWKQTFTYDRFGNRTFDAANTTTIPTDCSTAICNPSMDSGKNQITSGQGYLYDGDGNVTQTADNGKFIYDANNEIAEVRDASTNSLVNQYSFDGASARVKIVAGGTTTIFVHDAFGKTIAEYSSSAPTSNPKVNYMTSDLLGSPRIITDQTGQVTSRRDLTPFGEDISAGTGNRTASQFYGSSDGVRQKFTGQQRDEDAKLDYFNARHYSYSTGRFMSADNFGGKLSNPQTLNLYAYALNNPLKWVDPTGHFVDQFCAEKSANGQSCAGDSGDDPNCPECSCPQCVKDPSGIVRIGGDNGPLYKLYATVDFNISDSGVIGGPSDVSGRDGGAPDLSPSAWDLIPVVGSGRRALYNMSCGAKGGCNISRATGYAIQTAFDAATIVKATGEALLEDAVEEVSEVGASGVRGAEEETVVDTVERGSNCFVAGTLVRTEDGLKPIENIHVGDKVLSFDLENGHVEYQEVTRTFVSQTDVILRIVVDGEPKPIEVTLGHPFYAHLPRSDTSGEEYGEWVLSKDLNIGDLLRSPIGEWHPIRSIERIHDDKAVYNFEVAKNHDYFVGQNGWLVHNQCMTPDQKALKELVDEATNGGRKPLSVKDAETVLDWAKETKYPGVRAGAGDVSSPSNWKIPGNPPHIHIPGAGRGGHVPVQPGVKPR